MDATTDTSKDRSTRTSRRLPRRLVTLSTVLAAFAPLLFVASFVMFALPVRNPGVQNCGSPAVFLVRGTPDAQLYNDEGKAIHNWNQAQVRRAYDRRCSKAAAARAVPAGVLFVAFLAIGSIAAIISWRARRALSPHNRPGPDSDVTTFDDPTTDSAS